LGKCDAGHRLTLIDACRNDKKVKATKRSRLDVKAVTIPDGVGVLFSCGRGQFAHETKELKHGVFYYYAIRGLLGEAKDRDGAVTWDGLSAYVKRQVPRYVEEKVGDGAGQTPASMGNLEGESILVPAGKQVVDDKLPKTLKIEDKDSGFSMDFVLIPATGPKGFMMGSTAEERKAVMTETKDERPKAESPRHKVVISKPFYLGKYEVTQGQYKAIMGKNPSYFSKDGFGKDSVKEFSEKQLDSFPVEQVSWDDAQAFLKELTALATKKKIPYSFRLPSEAEWEFACRGGSENSEAFTFDKPSESISSLQANFNGNHPFGGADKGKYLRHTSKVGSYKPNPFGLYDMHGNVWEWCQDWYGEKYYSDSDEKDPKGPKDGKYRVLRGGSWCDHGRDCRSAHRNDYDPGGRNYGYGFGFRVACVNRQD
jgi:formylglycine-generating enzyme required for sulfatase activity